MVTPSPPSSFFLGSILIDGVDRLRLATTPGTMKNPMVTLLSLAVIFLYIVAALSLSNATSVYSMSQDARSSSLIAGVTGLILATGLLVFGVIMFRKRE